MVAVVLSVIVLTISITHSFLLNHMNANDDWKLLANNSWHAREGLMGTFYKGYIWMSGGRYSPDNPQNISNSTFYNDVYKLDPSCINTNNCKWQLVSNDNEWQKRAYHIMFNHTINNVDYMYIIGGQNLSTFYNDVWRSTDGIKWEQVLANNDKYYHVRAGLAAISNPNDGYIYVTSGCYDEFPNRQTLNDLWRSKDGAEWQPLIKDDKSSLMHIRSGPRIQIYDDILYIVAGEHGFNELTQLGDVWKINLKTINDNDDNQWSLVNANAQFYNRSGHGFVIDNDGVFWVIAGYYDLHDLWKSTDLGVSWTQSTNSVFNCKETEIHCGRYDFWSQLDDKNNLYIYGGDWDWSTFGGAYSETWESNLDQFK